MTPGSSRSNLSKNSSPKHLWPDIIRSGGQSQFLQLKQEQAEKEKELRK
jgi:hypothetical protein